MNQLPFFFVAASGMPVFTGVENRPSCPQLTSRTGIVVGVVEVGDWFVASWFG